MAYQVSGLDENRELWVIRAESKATAEHIAGLFLEKGYTHVVTKQVP